MPVRIPEPELEALKHSVDLPALIRSKGITLERHGKDLIGLCPFHNDTNPSLVVTAGQGLWHCLGACGKGGSVIDWVMCAEGVGFRHAVELLREGRLDQLVQTTEAGKPVNAGRVRRLESPIDTNGNDTEVLDQVVSYYEDTLAHRGKAALDYLQTRGIGDGKAISHFRLGYSNRTLGLRLPAKTTSDGAKIRSRLQSLGIYRKSGHEHLSGSVVIPVLDEKGKVQNLYGRKVLENLAARTPRHTYLPVPQEHFWNPESLQSRELILCESLFDALSFWVNGYHNVTTSFGINGFSEKMLSSLLAAGVRKVYIAYDRDEAGDGAAQKLSEKLLSEGVESLRVVFPHRMDANEYIQKVTPANQSLRVLLNSSQWLGRLQQTTEPSSSLAAKAAVEHQSEVPLGALAPKPQPSGPKADTVEAHRKGDDVTITLGERNYRIRGLEKSVGSTSLRITLRVSVGERFYLDTVDLYQAKQRQSFILAASQEVQVDADVLKRDLGRMLLKLEQMVEQSQEENNQEQAVVIPPERVAAAMELLRHPKLFERILADFDMCGVVGERYNKLMGYLGCVSRRMRKPLGIIIQSTSAGGKSALMDAVLSFMPKEQMVRYSAMTGQSLFYMGEGNLKHKILCIAEEEGAEKASYSLKLLQSEGRLMIASTGKDPKTGKLLTETYEVEGPVVLFLTTTKVDIDPELQNRCIILGVDESRDQTRAIQERQRFEETWEGVLAKNKAIGIKQLHQDAQRLLRPVEVYNPFAPKLSFLDTQTRNRRDNLKYLTLIRTIAFLRQYQKQLKKKDGLEAVEVELKDIELANRLAPEVFGRTLDELPPQTRRLLGMLHKLVEKISREREVEREQVRLTRWEIRQATGWGHSQLAIHLSRLVEMEYLLTHRGGNGSRFEYEVLYRGEGDEGGPFLLGLFDVNDFKNRNKSDYDSKLPGLNNNLPGSFRPTSGAVPGAFRGKENHQKAYEQSPEVKKVNKQGEKRTSGQKKDLRHNHSHIAENPSSASFPLAAVLTNGARGEA